MNIKPEELVYKRLKTVFDPELNIDIVRLGLIYKVETFAGKSNNDLQLAAPYPTMQEQAPKFGKIKITMTLTTPGCPLAPVINKMVRDAVFDLVADPDEDVVIDLTFDPPWTPDMMDEDAMLELGL